MEIKKLCKNILLILLIICLLVVIFYKGYMYLDIEKRFKDFESIKAVEIVGTLSYTEENAAKVENMDFITQDQIGVKIDSMSINDHTFSANVSFKIDEEFDYRKFGYAYAVYDDENNIYNIFSRMHIGENEKYDYNSLFMQRELNMKKTNDIYSMYLADSSGIESVSKVDNVITTKITMEAKDKFPKSKKIYIKILDLGYFEDSKEQNEQMNVKNYNLSDAKWQFEFDIPEEMNNRETINLGLMDEIDGIKIISATLTDTNLVINFESEDYTNLITEGKDMLVEEFSNKRVEMLNVTDGEGNIYQDLGGGTTANNGYKITYDVTKKDLDKKIFINFKIGDNQYKSELIKK